VSGLTDDDGAADAVDLLCVHVAVILGEPEGGSRGDMTRVEWPGRCWMQWCCTWEMGEGLVKQCDTIGTVGLVNVMTLQVDCAKSAWGY
jgi:hypothetical protein